MDNVRLFLLMALMFILLLIYQAWETDYGVKPAPYAAAPTSTTTPPAQTETPSTTATTPDASPEIPKATDAGITNLPLQGAGGARLIPTEQRVTVETDKFKVEIDTYGGDIRKVYLRDYPVAVKSPQVPFRLMNDELPNLFIAQAGLLAAKSADGEETAPTHLSTYTVEKNYYQLEKEANTLEVPLIWRNKAGITVRKIYIFNRDSHVIRVKYIVENQSTQAWEGQLYAQFQRTQVAEEGQSSMIYTYMGGAIGSPQSRYEKIDFHNIQTDTFNKENRQPWANGWAAMLQHYFLGAWIPAPELIFTYYTKYLPQGARHILGFYSTKQAVAPNAQHSFELSLYAGPKDQAVLAAISSGLDLTVDYGWFWFIAQPLFWMLEVIYNLIGNWGWAIIILTVLIKLAFFHLSATSYKSMANMRRVHPRLVQIKERYAEDRMKMNQAMMDLYKKEKINPLGGCLPILVQIPVFIALYWVLLESVELRQAPFMFWINDLSAADPFFVLPLIMGATMIIQQKLNPAPLDPIQEKMMLMLPIVFTFFFAFFPAGLVLYWVVNNGLSILQQWVINKQIVGDEKA